MKPLLQILSALALAATLAPAVLFFGGRIDLPTTKNLMLAGAVLWLVVTPFWMEHKAKD